MKVLMLSTDKSILETGSPAQKRMVEYGQLAEKLFIVVLSKKRSSGQILDISQNVKVYAKFFWGAWRLGKIFSSGGISAKGGPAYGWDLVTAQDPFETGLIGYLAAWRLKAKLQLQIHTDFLSPYFIKESLKNRIRVWLAKWLLPKADGIRVVSERIKKSVVGLGLPENKVVVLPIFVDGVKIQSTPVTVNLKKKYSDFDFIILMTSRFEKEKDIALAIQAMQEIVKEYPKTGLIIVGSGSLESRLKRQVQALDLKNNIKFEGWISDWEAYVSYYKTSDVYLLCSTYEGYGLVLVVAASAGLPLITTDVGIAGEKQIKDSGLVISVRDKQAIVDAVKKLHSDENLAKGLRERAREFVKEQEFKTKESYLQKYKQSWEMTL